MRSCTILIVATLLLGCATSSSKNNHASGPARPSELVTEGVADLRAGDADAAAHIFNRAIAQAPGKSGLHLLVGVAYHVQALHGNPAAADLAEVGYRLAYELDPSNYLAQLQLGRLYLDLRRYVRAEESFARVLDAVRDDPDAAYGLAVASYYARDLGMAIGSIALAQRLRPQSQDVHRANALIRSAVGMPEDARAAASRYAVLGPDAARIAHVGQRMAQWDQLNRESTADRAHLIAQSDDGQPVAAVAPANSNADRPGASVEGQVAANWADCHANGDNSPALGVSAGETETAALPALPSPCAGRPLPRMAMIDATFLRTEETVDSTQGINLLEGLELVFGYSRVSMRADTVGAGRASRSTVSTRSVGLPQASATYSLNVANAANLKSEVLARPSLLALDRTPSQFFSGTNITIAIPGQVSGGSVVEKPVGVSLSVTPTFVDDDTLLLSVKAGRTDFEKGEPGTFDQSLNTTRNYVIASALVKLDQTLILSGLFSSDLSTGKSGAPVLRDIPGLQYFFAAGSTHEFRKSILITLTPRRPAAGLSPTNASASRDEPLDPLVAKIRDRLNRDIVTAPNVLAVIRRLAGSNYVQQFRSGDLQEQDWRSERSLDRLLLELEHFLYF